MKTRESAHSVIESEILRVWGDDVLMTCERLAERLTHIPFERIKRALGQNADFIWNGRGEYTHIWKSSPLIKASHTKYNKDYDKILADAVAKSDVPLKEDSVLRFLFNEGYSQWLVETQCFASQ